MPSLDRKILILQERGVMGLIDERWLRRVDVLDTVDPEIVATVADVVAAPITHAELSQRKWLALNHAALAQKNLAISSRRLRSIVGELSRGQAAHRVARSRQTHANSPETTRIDVFQTDASAPARCLEANKMNPSAGPRELVKINAKPSTAHV